MKVERLYADFAVNVLRAQYGITHELAARRLLEAAEALAPFEPSIADVLTLAIDMHDLRRGAC